MLFLTSQTVYKLGDFRKLSDKLNNKRATVKPIEKSIPLKSRE